MGYIYKTTNLINNMTYVGKCKKDSTTTKSYFGSGFYLNSALKKYGKKNFKKEIIVEGDFNKVLLTQLELHYIRLYSPAISKNSYNLIENTAGVKFKEAAKDLTKKKSKKVYQWDINKNLINSFISCREAGRQLNIDSNSISKLIKTKGLSRKIKCYFTDTDSVVQPREILKQGKDCDLYKNNLFFKSFYSQKECADFLGLTVHKVCDLINKGGKFKEYYISNKGEHFRNKINNHTRSLALYNDNECYLFFSHREANKFLENEYGIKSHIIQKLITDKRNFRDYKIRTLWEDDNIICENKGKPTLIVLDENKNFLKKFKSIPEAVAYYNFPKNAETSIQKHRSRNTLYKNKYWKYEE